MRRTVPVIAALLLLTVGLGRVGGSWARFHARPQSVAGVVAELEGKSLEVRMPASSGTHLEWFRITDTTEIRTSGQRGSLADLRPGAEVTVTYFPARLSRAATRVEVR